VEPYGCGGYHYASITINCGVGERKCLGFKYSTLCALWLVVIDARLLRLRCMKTMKKNKKVREDPKQAKGAMAPVGSDFFERSWEQSWTYIRTVVDVMHEPILILDKDFRVVAANESFYGTFQVLPEDTEKKIVYKLGDGQWNIPALKKLLEDILPKNTFFRGFEVDHEFPSIGRKVMMLNARRIYRNTATSKAFPAIILLAMEDVTEMMSVARKLADHTTEFETELTKRTGRLETDLMKLMQEIKGLKKKN
jgi:PAS domain-containing protein